MAPLGGIVSGSLAAMKLDGWTREDATLKAPAAIVVRWPDLAIDRSPAARLSVRPGQLESIPLAEIAEAHRTSEHGHVRGRLVLVIG